MITENPLNITATELFESAFDHEKVAKTGLAIGPNIGYVRTYQRCAWAMRIVAKVIQKRWRHLKRGSEYYEVGRAELQYSAQPAMDGLKVVVYVGVDGKLWVRPEIEFEDGRFEKLP